MFSMEAITPLSPSVTIRRSRKQIALKWKAFCSSLVVVVCGWQSLWAVTVATVRSRSSQVCSCSCHRRVPFASKAQQVRVPPRCLTICAHTSRQRTRRRTAVTQLMVSLSKRRTFLSDQSGEHSKRTFVVCQGWCRVPSAAWQENRDRLFIFFKEKLDNFLTVLYSLCSVVPHMLQNSLTSPAGERRSCYS